MARNREPQSAVRILDRLVGEPLSWLTGAVPVDRGEGRGSLLDAALGELLSWTGLGGKRRRHHRSRP